MRELIGTAAIPLRMLRGRWKARRVPARDRVRGWIDVVLHARDVGRYIDACMRSVLAQDYWRVNVIVVDDGSIDDTGARLSRWRSRDSRVHVITVDYADPSAARNHGIKLGRAEFLTFLDGDDILLDGAYRDMLAALRSSGSEFAVGGYDRLRGGRRVPAAFWIDEAHASERTALDVGVFPEAMVNAVQWSKVYRREFWDRAGLVFPVGRCFRDQEVSARAFARANAFDVVSRRIVSWRVRDDGSSLTQQFSSDFVLDRFAASASALEVLAREATPVIVRERIIQLLSNDFAILASKLLVLEPDGIEALRTGLARLAPDREREDIWSRVPAGSKVLFELLIAGDVGRARRYIELGGLDLLRHRLLSIDGVPYVELPYWGDRDAAVPRSAFRAAPRDINAFAAHSRGVFDDISRAAARTDSHRTVELTSRPK